MANVAGDTGGGSYPSDWLSWATGVLQGIGAPVNDTNLSSLWNWTQAEKPHGAGMSTQWNNPLNTTQNAAGASSVNSVGVKAYPDIQTGVQATVETLLNGNYGNIVSNLRGSVSAPNWGNACGDLGTWGTGCSWIGNAAFIIGGAASAVGNVVSGAGGAASSAGSGLDAFGKLAGCATNPAFWWRAGLTMLASGLIVIGIIGYATSKVDVGDVVKTATAA